LLPFCRFTVTPACLVTVSSCLRYRSCLPAACRACLPPPGLPFPAVLPAVSPAWICVRYLPRITTCLPLPATPAGWIPFCRFSSACCRLRFRFYRFWVDYRSACRFVIPLVLVACRVTTWVPFWVSFYTCLPFVSCLGGFRSATAWVRHRRSACVLCHRSAPACCHLPFLPLHLLLRSFLQVLPPAFSRFLPAPFLHLGYRFPGCCMLPLLRFTCYRRFLLPACRGLSATVSPFLLLPAVLHLLPFCQFSFTGFHRSTAAVLPALHLPLPLPFTACHRIYLRSCALYAAVSAVLPAQFCHLDYVHRHTWFVRSFTGLRYWILLRFTTTCLLPHVLPALPPATCRLRSFAACGLPGLLPAYVRFYRYLSIVRSFCTCRYLLPFTCGCLPPATACLPRSHRFCHFWTCAYRLGLGHRSISLLLYHYHRFVLPPFYLPFYRSVTTVTVTVGYLPAVTVLFCHRSGLPFVWISPPATCLLPPPGSWVLPFCTWVWVVSAVLVTCVHLPAVLPPLPRLPALPPLAVADACHLHCTCVSAVRSSGSSYLLHRSTAATVD